MSKHWVQTTDGFWCADPKPADIPALNDPATIGQYVRHISSCPRCLVTGLPCWKALALVLPREEIEQLQEEQRRNSGSAAIA